MKKKILSEILNTSDENITVMSPYLYKVDSITYFFLNEDEVDEVIDAYCIDLQHDLEYEIPEQYRPYMNWNKYWEDAWLDIWDCYPDIEEVRGSDGKYYYYQVW